jgi:Tol biopolymer transport system component
VPGLGYDGGGNHSIFSPDGKELFYLVHKQTSRTWNSGELRVADLDSDRTEAFLPGVSMTGFDIAQDGERVAFEAPDAEGKSHVWVAHLDHGLHPKQLDSSGDHELFLDREEKSIF